MTGVWRPPVDERRLVVEPAPVAALTALLDDGLPAPGDGDPLPALWHWAALATWPPASQVGSDGHPRPGGLLPPGTPRRRMAAGGSVVLHAPLRVGSAVRLRRQVVSMQDKQGRSGPLVLVTVRSQVSDVTGTPLLEEDQHLVFLDAAPAPAPAPPSPGTPGGPPLSRDGDGWQLATDPVLLLRFSAATANGHRIHYDAPYAVDTEGYPGLLVHGPLLAVALLEVLRLERPGAPVRSLSFRARAPLFCGERARLTHRDEGPTARLTAQRGDDVLLTAEVVGG